MSNDVLWIFQQVEFSMYMCLAQIDGDYERWAESGKNIPFTFIRMASQTKPFLFSRSSNKT